MLIELLHDGIIILMSDTLKCTGLSGLVLITAAAARSAWSRWSYTMTFCSQITMDPPMLKQLRRYV